MSIAIQTAPINELYDPFSFATSIAGADTGEARDVFDLKIGAGVNLVFVNNDIADIKLSISGNEIGSCCDTATLPSLVLTVAAGESLQLNLSNGYTQLTSVTVNYLDASDVPAVPVSALVGSYVSGEC